MKKGRSMQEQRELKHRSAVEASPSDRGDVPGWVLITVMSAGLVAGLWTIADAQLAALLTSALDSVTGR